MRVALVQAVHLVQVITYLSLDCIQIATLKLELVTGLFKTPVSQVVMTLLETEQGLILMPLHKTQAMLQELITFLHTSLKTIS